MRTLKALLRKALASTASLLLVLQPSFTSGSTNVSGPGADGTYQVSRNDYHDGFLTSVYDASQDQTTYYLGQKKTRTTWKFADGEQTIEEYQYAENGDLKYIVDTRTGSRTVFENGRAVRDEMSIDGVWKTQADYTYDSDGHLKQKIVYGYTTEDLNGDGQPDGKIITQSIDYENNQPKRVNSYYAQVNGAWVPSSTVAQRYVYSGTRLVAIEDVGANGGVTGLTVFVDGKETYKLSITENQSVAYVSGKIYIGGVEVNGDNFHVPSNADGSSVAQGQAIELRTTNGAKVATMTQQTFYSGARKSYVAQYDTSNDGNNQELRETVGGYTYVYARNAETNEKGELLRREGTTVINGITYKITYTGENLSSKTFDEDGEKTGDNAAFITAIEASQTTNGVTTTWTINYSFSVKTDPNSTTTETKTYDFGKSPVDNGEQFVVETRVSRVESTRQFTEGGRTIEETVTATTVYDKLSTESSGSITTTTRARVNSDGTKTVYQIVERDSIKNTVKTTTIGADQTTIVTADGDGRVIDQETKLGNLSWHTDYSFGRAVNMVYFDSHGEESYSVENIWDGVASSPSAQQPQQIVKTLNEMNYTTKNLDVVWNYPMSATVLRKVVDGSSVNGPITGVNIAGEWTIDLTDNSEYAQQFRAAIAAAESLKGSDPEAYAQAIDAALTAAITKWLDLETTKTMLRERHMTLAAVGDDAVKVHVSQSDNAASGGSGTDNTTPTVTTTEDITISLNFTETITYAPGARICTYSFTDLKGANTYANITYFNSNGQELATWAAYGNFNPNGTFNVVNGSNAQYRYYDPAAYGRLSLQNGDVVMTMDVDRTSQNSVYHLTYASLSARDAESLSDTERAILADLEATKDSSEGMFSSTLAQEYGFGENDKTFNVKVYSINGYDETRIALDAQHIQALRDLGFTDLVVTSDRLERLDTAAQGDIASDNNTNANDNRINWHAAADEMAQISSENGGLGYGQGTFERLGTNSYRYTYMDVNGQQQVKTGDYSYMINSGIMRGIINTWTAKRDEVRTQVETSMRSWGYLDANAPLTDSMINTAIAQMSGENVATVINNNMQTQLMTIAAKGGYVALEWDFSTTDSNGTRMIFADRILNYYSPANAAAGPNF